MTLPNPSHAGEQDGVYINFLASLPQQRVVYLKTDLLSDPVKELLIIHHAEY